MTEPSHATYETCRGVVYPWEMDMMGHLNVQHYVRRFDEASWHLLSVTPAPEAR